MGDDIKPCPFCGSKDIIVFTKNDEYYTGWHMKCMRCGVEGPDNGQTEPHDGKKLAQDMWNKRALI
jgi:Lar family restriction alleviation protein